jgi:hypothetical protein
MRRSWLARKVAASTVTTSPVSPHASGEMTGCEREADERRAELVEPIGDDQGEE